MQVKTHRIAIVTMALASLNICVTLTGVGCRALPATAPDGGIKANAGAKRTLGAFRPVSGTTYLMAPVTSQTEGEYSKGESHNVHNHVFCNTVDESTHVLLRTDDYWIVETKSLPERQEAADREPAAVQWFLYFLVKLDTDGDRKLTSKDNKTLAVSDAGGVGFAEIIPDIEH